MRRLDNTVNFVRFVAHVNDVYKNTLQLLVFNDYETSSVAYKNVL